MTHNIFTLLCFVFLFFLIYTTHITKSHSFYSFHLQGLYGVVVSFCSCLFVISLYIAKFKKTYVPLSCLEVAECLIAILKVTNLWFPWKAAEKLMVFFNLAFIPFCCREAEAYRWEVLFYCGLNSVYHYYFAKKVPWWQLLDKRQSNLLSFVCLFLIFSRELQARR